MKKALTDRKLFSKPPYYLHNNYACFEAWSDPDATCALTNDFVLSLVERPTRRSKDGMLAQVMLASVSAKKKGASATSMFVGNAYRHVSNLQRLQDPGGYAAYEHVTKSLLRAKQRGHLRWKEPNLSLRKGRHRDQVGHAIFYVGKRRPSKVATSAEVDAFLTKREGWPAFTEATPKRSEPAKRWLEPALVALAAATGRAVRRSEVLEVVAREARSRMPPRHQLRVATEIDGLVGEAPQQAQITLEYDLRLQSLETRLLRLLESSASYESPRELLDYLKERRRLGDVSTTKGEVAERLGWTRPKLERAHAVLQQLMMEMEEER